MNALPRDLSPSRGEQFTGLICPDCRGSIVVRVEGPAHRLVFRCRVGHAYNADDMLIGKEDHLEASLWTAVHACEELVAFLKDLDNDVPTLSPDERHRRITKLQKNGEVLRGLITNDRALKLQQVAEAPDGGE